MTDSGLRRHATQGLVFHQFAHLADIPGLVHAVSTRIGGVSRPPYESLNLAAHVGDDAADVLANRRRLSRALDIDPESWVTPEQVHQLNVAVVDADIAANHRVIPASDALIARAPTDRKPLTLAVFSADCPLILIAHRSGSALGVVHAGWRTTVGGLPQKTVRTLCDEFRLVPIDLLAGISPGIGPDCYEVGDDVHDQARSQATRCERFMRRSGGGWLFDLWQANRTQLLEAGLRDEHIVAAGRCNHCHTDEFYSYRTQGPTTGRHALVAGFR